MKFIFSKNWPTSSLNIEIGKRFLVGIIALIIAPTTSAQDQQYDTLEEIIVTAQKREQGLQEVPIAISVIDSTDLENRGIASFDELFQSMPNTTIDQRVAAIPAITIRGVSSSADNVGIESAIGVQIDDVFLGRPAAFSSNLIDVERVEVLRGPQGTLFGKNTIGGLINITTRKPTDEFAASYDITLGEDNLQQFRGYASGKIGNNIAGKISTTIRQQDGWAENRNPNGEDFNGQDYWGVRAQLLGTPTDKFSWLFTIEAGENEGAENFVDILSGALAPLDGDPFDRSIETSENDVFERETYGVSLKLDWEMGEFDVVSVTAARGVDWIGRNDQDQSVLKILETGRTEDQDQFSQEFRILGGDEEFNWIAGAYYFSQTQDSEEVIFIDEDILGLFGIPSIPGFNEQASSIVAIDTESVAAYYSFEYAINNQLNIAGGARITKEEKEYDFVQPLKLFELFPGFSLGVIAAFFPDIPQQPTQKRSDTDTSGNISLSYAFSDDVNAYTSVSRGFKAGGYATNVQGFGESGNDFDVASLEFDSETLTSYEVGLKSTLAEGRVRLNMAAFYSDYQDKQEQFFNGDAVTTGNAASASISGFEVDLVAQLGSITTLSASLGYQDSKYDDYNDPILGDFTDNQLALVPEVTASMGLQFANQLNNGWKWRSRIDAAYQDESFARPDNDPLFTIDDSVLVNASIGLINPSDKYSVSLWVKNLFDEDYIIARKETAILDTQFLGINPPRLWGVEFRAKFGEAD